METVSETKTFAESVANKRTKKLTSEGNRPNSQLIGSKREELFMIPGRL